MSGMDYDGALERARTPDELVWHYTTLDTLTHILQSNSLLATEVSFQNDIRETTTADDAFREVLDRLHGTDDYRVFATEALRFLDDEDTWEPFVPSPTHALTRNARFIVCAAGEPDSLYAWRTYAQQGIGCAIGLDPDVPLGIVDPTGTRHRVRHWRKVVYSPGQVRKEAQRILLRLADEWRNRAGDMATQHDLDEAFGVLVLNLVDARSRVRAIAKDPSFKDEDERRVTVESVSRHALMTTPSNMGPRPHVRLVAVEDGRWGDAVIRADLAPKLPIRAIRLGPNAPESADAATQWLLFANGYPLDPVHVDEDNVRPGSELTWEHAVVIDRSDHPYRAR